MPTRPISAIVLTLTGALACVPPLAPAHAADLDDAQALTTEWAAPDDDADRLARDLLPAPVPTKPSIGPARHPVVTLRPTEPVVSIGSPISFEVGSSASGYGHLYVLSASGRVQVWMENVSIAAGQRLVFPTRRAAIEAAPPAGREDLMLIVTRTRIDGFVSDETTRVPRELPYDPRAFKQALTAKFVDRPHRDWGYARATVRVVERSAQGPGWGWGAGGPDAWDSD